MSMCNVQSDLERTSPTFNHAFARREKGNGRRRQIMVLQERASRCETKAKNPTMNGPMMQE